jgi:hypothetical protein
MTPTAPLSINTSVTTVHEHQTFTQPSSQTSPQRSRSRVPSAASLEVYSPDGSKINIWYFYRILNLSDLPIF